MVEYAEIVGAIIAKTVCTAVEYAYKTTIVVLVGCYILDHI